MSETQISAVLTVEGLRKFQSDMNTAADAVDKTGKRGQRAGEMLGKYGKLGFLAAGAGAVIAVKKFANFDDALNRVQINSGASAKEMVKLEKAARKMGEKFPASATEVADAMNEILKAGMSVEDMMGGGLENALAMATAEGMDMAVAAGAMSQAMSVFAIKGKDANKVTAALSNVASATSADVNDLTLSLGQVGGTAAAAGMGVGETSAALGVLIQNGLDGSKAGTALNAMLLSLRAPTDKAAKALKQAGVEVYDTSGKMKPFRQVLGSVQKALAGMSSDQERAVFLQKTMGVDAQQAASILAKQVPLYDKLAASTKQLDAPVDKARQQMQSLGMQLDTTGESLGNMAMKVGGALAPAIATVLPQIQSFAASIGSNTGGIEAFGQAIVQVGTGVATAIVPPLQIAGALLSTLGGVLGSTNGGLLQFAGTLATVAVAARLLGPAMLAVKTSMIVATEMAAVQAALSGASGAMGMLAGASGAASIGIGALATAAKAAMVTVLPLLLIAGVATAMFSAADSSRGLAGALGSARDNARELKTVLDELEGSALSLSGAELAVKETTNQLAQARENAAKAGKDSNLTESQREAAVLAVERAEIRAKEAVINRDKVLKDHTAVVDKATKKGDDFTKSVDKSASAAGKAVDPYQAAATQAALMGDEGAKSTTSIATFSGSMDKAAGTAGDLAGAADDAAGAVRKIPGSKTVTIKAETSGFASAMDFVRRAVDSLPTSKTITVRTKQTKATGGPVVAMAAGGRVRGAGTGTSDSVPAMLSAGEWVLTAKQAKAIGYGQLASLPHFAQGGAWFTSQATAAGNLSSSGTAHWKAMERAGTTDNLADDRAALAAHAALLQGRLDTIRNEAPKGEGSGAAKSAAVSSVQGMIRDVNASIWQIDNIGTPAAAKAEASRIAGLKADEAAAGTQAAAAAASAAASAATQATADAASAAKQATQDTISGVGAKGSDMWKRSSMAATTETLADDLVVLQERLAALQAIGPAAAAEIADAEADIWTMLNITMPGQAATAAESAATAAAAAAAQQDAMRNEAAMAMGRGFYAASGGAGGGNSMGTTDSTGGGASGVGHAPRPEIDRVWLAGAQLNDLDARTGGAGVTITEILGWDEAEDMESTRSKRADGDALGGVRDGSVKVVVQGRLTGSSYQDYHERRRALKALVRAATTETLLKVPDVTYGDEAGDYGSTYADTGMVGMERRRVRLVANIKWGDSFGLFGSEFEFELRSPHRYVEADVAADAPSGSNAAAVTASTAARTSILAIRGEIAASPAMDAAVKFAGTSSESEIAVRAGATAAALDTFTKLTDPASLPAGSGIGTAFSADGTYLAVAHGTTPYLTIYKRSGDTYTKLTNPATLPTGTGNMPAFSDDGTYLAVAHTASPYVTIYKRSGDTYTKLTDPASLPAGDGVGAHFSPDGTYLAVAHTTSPYVTIYKRAGDVFTKLANPATLPTGNGVGTAFDPTGTYLAVTHGTSPYVTIYKRAGDVFTKLADPATLPTGNGNRAPSFSPDGTYLAVAHTTSPYVTIYKRSGDTFTKLADPATLPPSTGVGASFSPDGAYLAVAHLSSPYVTIYKRAGDVFTKLTNPSTLPAGSGFGAAFDPTAGAYLAVAHSTSPYVTIYAASGSGAAYAALGTIRISPPALAIEDSADMLPVASADISSSQPLTNQDAFEIDTIAGTATPIHRTPLARMIGGGSFVAAMIPARNAGTGSGVGKPTNLRNYVTRSKSAGDALVALGGFLWSSNAVVNEGATALDDYIGLLGALTSTSPQVATGLPGWRAKMSGANFTASSYVARTINTAFGQPRSQPVIHTMVVKPAASWATATTDLAAFGSGVTKFAHLLTLTTVAGSTNHVNAVGFFHNGTRLVPTCARYDDKATDGYRLTYSSAALSATPDPALHVWVAAIIDAGTNVWTAIALLDVNTGEPVMWFVEGHDLFDGEASEVTSGDYSQATTTTTSGTLDSSVAYPTAATRLLGCGTSAAWAASVAGTTVPAGGMGPVITLDAASELFAHGITSAATLTDASTATNYAAIAAAIVDWIGARFAPQTIRRTPIALETEWTDIVPDLHGEPVIRLDSVPNSTTAQALGASRTGGVSTEQMVAAAAGGAGATPIEAREVR